MQNILKFKALEFQDLRFGPAGLKPEVSPSIRNVDVSAEESSRYWGLDSQNMLFRGGGRGGGNDGSLGMLLQQPCKAV